MSRPCTLNQALIRPIHRHPTSNDILPKLTNAHFMTIIDASSHYHSLRLNEEPMYLTMFTCQFGRYRFTRLPFEVMPVDDVFQQKRDKIFKDLPNVFGIAHNILIAGYSADHRDHDRTVR